MRIEPILEIALLQLQLALTVHPWTMKRMSSRRIVINLPAMPNPHYAALLCTGWGAVVGAGLDEEASVEHDGQITDVEIQDLFAEVYCRLPGGTE